MIRSSGINTAGYAAEASRRARELSRSLEDTMVTADLVYSQNDNGIEVSSSPVNKFLAPNLSQASADFVFKMHSDKSTGVSTDSISPAKSREMFQNREKESLNKNNPQLQKLRSFPLKKRNSALTRTLSLPAEENVDNNTPFDALKQARSGRSSGALGAFIVNKIDLDNAKISEPETVNNKDKHITKWPTPASLQATEHKIEHKVGDEGEDEGVIQDKKFIPSLTTVTEEEGSQSGSSRESSPVSRDNGPSFQSERSVSSAQSSSSVLSPQDSLNNEQREAILLSSQPSPRIGEELSPVTSSKMSLPPQLSETVAPYDAGALYGSNRTTASAAPTQIDSPREKAVASPRQFDSSQSEEVFESPIKLDSLQSENDVASPRKVDSSLGKKADEPPMDKQDLLEQMNALLLINSKEYPKQQKVLAAQTTMESGTSSKILQNGMESGTSSRILRQDVGHYNPQTKLYSFKTLPRQLPNGSLANAERTVLLNQYQLSETLINLSRHTDFCKRGKNYELFFQLNDDNSLTAIAKESQAIKNSKRQTLNDGNGINFLFRNSHDNDLFSIPVAITQSPIQPQPQAPQLQPQQSQGQSYLGTYDSGTSRYKFNTSESRTSQEIEFSELNFLRFLDINKDKFKSNGNFSVAVQIREGKAVAIPIPHKDDNQQPNSKYIHVGSEKIDLKELELKIIDAEARENLILGLKTSRRPAGYVSPLRYSPIGISSRYNV